MNKDTVAIYCRLSKEDDDKINKGDDSESIQNQKSLLIDYALKQDWSIYEVYSDDDRKGFDRDRPAFNKLINDAERSKFNIVLCKHQSRFTRDMEIVEKYIHSEFANKGIRFVSIIDHVDTNIKGTKKARQVNSLVNEWYSEDLSENIRTVFRKKMEDGQDMRGFVPYGYIKGVNHTWIIDEEAAPVVREIFAMYFSGTAPYSIAQILTNRRIPPPSQHKANQGLNFSNPNIQFGLKHGTWSINTIRRILRNEAYIGTLIQGQCKKVSYKSKKVISVPRKEWFIVEDHHEPLIDKKTFDTVQTLIERRRTIKGYGIKAISPPIPNIFSGKLICGDCGNGMHRSGASRDNKFHYLRCQLAAKSKNKDCTPHYVAQETLESILLSKIKELINSVILADGNNDIVNEVLLKVTDSKEQKNRKQKQLFTTKQELKKVQNSLVTLYSDKTEGIITTEEYIELKYEFSKNKQNLLSKKDTIEKEIADFESKIDSSEVVMDLLEKYKTIDKLTHEIINDFIDNITIYEKDQETNQLNITINWAF